jgi:hypothetical protein
MAEGIVFLNFKTKNVELDVDRVQDWLVETSPPCASVRPNCSCSAETDRVSMPLNRDRQCIKGTVLWGLQEADKGLRVEPL